MPLSYVQLTAATTEILTSNGYQQVDLPSSWPSESRLYEDDYGIVALFVYDTWIRLRGEWNVAQGQLVDLISARLNRPDPKSWEGYLLLFTTASVPSDQRRDVTDLRYNTNRLRKLVATADEIDTVEDVHTALLPLLPLDTGSPSSSGSGLLSRLPDLLSAERVSRRVTEAVVDSFLANESMMESLHRLDETP
jgi:hypothetical protein